MRYKRRSENGGGALKGKSIGRPVSHMNIARQGVVRRPSDVSK